MSPPGEPLGGTLGQTHVERGGSIGGHGTLRPTAFAGRVPGCDPEHAMMLTSAPRRKEDEIGVSGRRRSYLIGAPTPCGRGRGMTSPAGRDIAVASAAGSARSNAFSSGRERSGMAQGRLTAESVGELQEGSLSRRLRPCRGWRLDEAAGRHATQSGLNDPVRSQVIEIQQSPILLTPIVGGGIGVRSLASRNGVAPLRVGVRGEDYGPVDRPRSG